MSGQLIQLSKEIINKKSSERIIGKYNEYHDYALGAKDRVELYKSFYEELQISLKEDSLKDETRGKISKLLKQIDELINFEESQIKNMNTIMDSLHETYKQRFGGHQ